MLNTTIYSDIFTIHAPAKQVWQTLTDLSSYPEWNTFTTKVVGQPKIGTDVELHVHMPVRGDRISTETVKCVEEGKQLSWGMTMLLPIFLKAQRDQVLIPIDEHSCTYQTWDSLSGLLAPLVVALFGEEMRNGFNRVGQGLKQRCELP